MMNSRAKRERFFIASFTPLTVYPCVIFLCFLLLLVISTFILKRERGRIADGFLNLIGIKTTKDLLFLFLIMLAALFVLMVLILSLGFLPTAPPLPA
ncbi:hypothetical protein H5T87_10915 [bacterium]|nr:hypothetical protein [bacterium]